MGWRLVYVHLRKDTMEPFYVGAGSATRAFSPHGRSAAWQNIAGIAGFHVEVLEQGLTQEDSFALEKQHIARLKGEGFSLCNRTDGGKGLCGIKMSDGHKLALAVSKLGNTHTKGQTRGAETRAKMSLAQQGNTNKLGWVTPDSVKQAISETNKRTYKDRNRAEISSKIMADKWADPAHREKAVAGMKSSAANRVMPSGDDHPRSDKAVYSFVHKDGRSFEGKRFEMAQAFGLKPYGVGWIITGKKKSYHGWSLRK